MDNETRVYKQGSLTFILTPTRTIVRTSLPQTFFLKETAHYFRRRLNLIRIMIEVDQIKTLDDLATWGGTGILWVSTSNKDSVVPDEPAVYS